MYELREELTKEFILSKIKEEDIFHKYMGIYPNTIDYFTNPFRQDTYPDCKFYIDGRGVLKFNDFAYRWNVDCFNVVQKVNNGCTYGEALHIIAKDFKLYDKEIDFRPIEIDEIFKAEHKTIGREIGVQRKEFTNWDREFWFSQGWTPESLAYFKVGSLLRAWIDKRQIYTYSKRDPGFVFFFGMKNFIPQYKLYFPLRDRFRFLQNTSNILQGYEQLPAEGDYLLITKSYKDVGALRGFDIPAVAPMSETTIITPDQFGELENRFFNIYTLFDRDRAGMIASQIYRKQYNTKPLLFETTNKLFRTQGEPKDFTDNYKTYGLNYMIDLVEMYKTELL